jgi:hypothetical protein
MPFQPGQSGNPGGRPPENNKLKGLARAHTEEAIKVLYSVMVGEDSKPGERVSAANSLLDRGYGRPYQALTGDPEGGPIMVAFTWLKPSE